MYCCSAPSCKQLACHDYLDHVTAGAANFRAKQQPCWPIQSPASPCNSSQVSPVCLKAPCSSQATLYGDKSICNLIRKNIDHVPQTSRPGALHRQEIAKLPHETPSLDKQGCFCKLVFLSDCKETCMIKLTCRTPALSLSYTRKGRPCCKSIPAYVAIK